ncbi:MAG: hypothetical protein ACK4NW_10715 [Roseinatronobacter sp.]
MTLVIKTPEDLRAEQQAQEHARRRAEALALLESTDWMILRRAETGQPVPDNVTQRRAEARATLNG